ncbi:MAG: alcohol dehydrogenase catalytic domain-containing protein, partial [Oscillospiraceae bacterium]|nr:alcohol dehydrogenase catalytic domain-containing protein [Oscillospiraceae bacterium]
MKIRAALAREKGKLTIEELNLEEPRLGEVVVKMVASGVCHTDSSTMEMFVPTKLPIVLGHEGVGVVEKVGEGVKTLKPGDHVIMSFPSCGCCEKCLEGHPYACDRSTELFFFGTYADGDTRITDDNGVKVGSLFGQGSFATYCVIDEHNAVKVDPEVDLKPLCSLGCGVQTGAGTVLNRMKPKPGDTMVVFGCGAVGISGIMAAKLAGCSTIIGVDIVPSR